MSESLIHVKSCLFSLVFDSEKILVLPYAKGEAVPGAGFELRAALGQK